MVRSNPERESRIYELWQRSETIDEISVVTGIPRSTVGYYVGKFNRDAKKRRLRLGEGLENRTAIPPRSSEDGSKTDLFNSALLKIIDFDDILNRAKGFIATGRFDQLYYLLRCWKLLPQTLNTLTLTTEEMGELQRQQNVLLEMMNTAINMSAGKGPPSASSESPSVATPEPKKEIQSFTELFGERPKQNARLYMDNFLNPQPQKTKEKASR
jgi:hypothetical protein